MKILVDQNISHRILPFISFLFEEIDHVKTNNWINWADHDIFMTARKLQYDAVITMDEDFNQLLLTYGTPPKIIWLKTGNCSTAKLIDVVISHKDAIKNFLSSTSFDCLEIYG